jgi:hypothetical protein
MAQSLVKDMDFSRIHQIEIDKADGRIYLIDDQGKPKVVYSSTGAIKAVERKMGSPSNWNSSGTEDHRIYVRI